MTLYEKIIQMAQESKDFHVNLYENTLRIGDKYIIRNGKTDDAYTGMQVVPTKLYGLTQNKLLQVLTCMYVEYRHSVPEAGWSLSRPYFKALRKDELSEMDYFEGRLRSSMQVHLESLILCCKIAGILQWTGELQGWYWKSWICSSFVLLKEWIDTN